MSARKRGYIDHVGQTVGAIASSNSSVLQASMTHSPIQTPGGGNAAFVGLSGAMVYSKEGDFVPGCFCFFLVSERLLCFSVFLWFFD